MNMAHAAPAFGTLKPDPATKVAIVRSMWHSHCTQSLTDDAIKALIETGIKKENIRVIDVPGSFEIPLFCKLAIEEWKADGVIAFGVIVKGETHHDHLIASESGRGCMAVQLTSGVPVTYEVLHVDDIKHAEARSIGAQGKGRLAAMTLLTSLARKRELS